jgi:hypothetical protein
MNPQEEKRLALEIDQALRGLPELQAPATLIPRVRAALERRPSAPGYQHPWPDWPLPIRAAALIMLAAVFAALCYGAWRLPDTEGYVAATRHAAGWFAGLTALWSALNALILTLTRAVETLGRVFLVGCLAAAAFAWVLCLGLGAACLRLALTRR